jgi:hypothetical protein
VVTHKRLTELFVYVKSSGDFIRRVATGRNGCHRAGEYAGTIQNHGYLVISVDKKRYMAHRLAWFYVHGVWPKGDLDHINEDKLDNRIDNLREATRRQNMQNVRRHKHNTSGYKGVAWHHQRSKWRAYIFDNYRQIHLGLFDSREAAAAARSKAEKEYHSHRVAK